MLDPAFDLHVNEAGIIRTASGKADVTSLSDIVSDRPIKSSNEYHLTFGF